MGACASTAEQSESAELDAQLEAMQAEEAQVLKLLLLGTGECGKSTILKQMQILSGTGFNAREIQTFREIIHANILDAIQSLVRCCQTSGIYFAHPQSDALAHSLLSMTADAGAFPSEELLELVQHFWIHEQAAMQGAIGLRNFTLLDSASYFLNDAARCLSPDFIPSNSDVVRARVRTTGVNEFKLQFGQDAFIFIDVGGQRGERKKWIHAFSDVSALFYVASLSEYDQTLAEDPSRNRMAESLQLFEAIIHQKWFANTPIILFLNKVDLFRDKIRHVDLGHFCPDYTDGCNADLALSWIRSTYLSLSRLPSKQIYVHVTNATDTKGIDFVWQAARKIIINQNLQNLRLV